MIEAEAVLEKLSIHTDAADNPRRLPCTTSCFTSNSFYKFSYENIQGYQAK
jgi:hypothetical protein